MSFVDELPNKTYDETVNRTGVDYVKFVEDYRVTLRMLDEKARMVWKHFIPQANKGRGWSVVCPNITAQTTVCPIEASAAHLPKEDQERKNSYARRRYIVNVLDRTPVTTCNNCNTVTPGQKCISCGASLKGLDFSPLNKVKILEGGRRLFVENLLAIDKMQREDIGKEITEYDITFTTSGTGRDKKITPLPRDPSPLSASDLLDENGEPQKKFSLDDLTEPTPLEEIEILIAGGGPDELSAVRSGGNKELVAVSTYPLRKKAEKDDLPFD